MRTEMRAAIALAGFLFCASRALACGYCVEDKVASTYDHAVVLKALSQKHQVAFFHIDGPIPPGDSSKRWLESAAESVPGVDKGTVRVAVDTMTLSFAFNPGRVPLVAVQTGIDRKLAAKKLAVMPLKVIEREAELKSVKR